MTVVAPGAHLAPVDLPPPHPSADPREPSPAVRTRTPQRTHRSPRPSRSSSPNPAAVDATTPPPLLHPRPKAASAAASPAPIGSMLGPSTGSHAHPLHSHSHPHLPPHAAHLSISRPGSPASIHSSGSAIFERDIELPAVASLSLSSQPQLNHKPSRLLPHGSALDHSVPAVLDDAVEALAGTTAPIDALEIEAPAPAAIGMARQSSSSLPAARSPGQSLSRSPSPASAMSGSPLASPRSPPILGQLALQQAAQYAGSGPASPTRSPQRPPLGTRTSTGPLLPGGWGFRDGREDTTDKEDTATSPSAANPPSSIPTHLTPTKEKRRISFISYNDLLLSVPTTVTSLNEIASGNLSPDHLPGTVSPSAVARSPVQPGIGSDGASGVPHKSSWETAGRGGLGLGEGEWERQGLGRGLEQRLEDLVQHAP